ncbi:hypothetical protein C2E15_05250 [Mixta gaviniae]|uniref:Uncharacterized protein n=1 Tax=Mixta gaviniae TaxID=665914 RepID=A0A1X1E192_9GAMM|nr:hypothetical protein C2E15_05250 [Mixta gaviniae]ORM82666.1 hypothetical protein HA44_07035 [Mixta gaviniae]
MPPAYSGRSAAPPAASASQPEIKLANPQEAKALYSITAERDGARIVAAVYQRMVGAIAAMLARGALNRQRAAHKKIPAGIADGDPQ